jgi:hypothetical protein
MRRVAVNDEKADGNAMLPSQLSRKAGFARFPFPILILGSVKEARLSTRGHRSTSPELAASANPAKWIGRGIRTDPEVHAGSEDPQILNKVGYVLSTAP